MGNARDRKATVGSDAKGTTDAIPGIQDRQPRTARGERTRQALIAAAAAEFGEKGFHEGSITGITQRAGVALGSFYTYFESKDALFRALVAAMSEQVRDKVAVTPRVVAKSRHCLSASHGSAGSRPPLHFSKPRAISSL